MEDEEEHVSRYWMALRKGETENFRSNSLEHSLRMGLLTCRKKGYEIEDVDWLYLADNTILRQVLGNPVIKFLVAYRGEIVI
jgi:hypothetical protein